MPKAGEEDGLRTTERRTVLFGLGAIALGGPLLSRPADAAGSHAVPLDLSDLEARHGGRLGVSASRGGARLDWRGGERFAYCSTFKLFLAAATLARVERGEEALDRPVPVTAADVLPHAPVTRPAVGSTLTIGTLCRAAAELSDNPASNILIREMGGLDAWRGWYPSLGDGVTRVDRLELDLNSAVPGDPRDTTTPSQTIANLDAVLLGDVLSPANRDRLTGWLVATPTGPGRIKAGVPTGWRVAHKTGTGRLPVNDIAVLWPSSGEPIVIALYYAEMRKAPLAEREAVLAEATRLVVAALAGD